MNPSLSTQIHRAVYALPLLAVGLAAAICADTLPAETLAGVPGSSSHVFVEVVTPAAGGAATTLPAPALSEASALALESVPGLDCSAMPAAGPRGLARMPGDITALAVRLRCAQ